MHPITAVNFYMIHSWNTFQATVPHWKHVYALILQTLFNKGETAQNQIELSKLKWKSPNLTQV